MSGSNTPAESGAPRPAPPADADREAELRTGRARFEAEQLAAACAHWAENPERFPPARRADVVAPPPPGEDAPPDWLGKAATPAMADEYAGLMAEVAAENRRHVGRRVIEVLAEYALGGDEGELEQRFFDWTRRYLGARLRPDRAYYKHEGDPLLLTQAVLHDEVQRLITVPLERPGRVNYAFLMDAAQYAGLFPFLLARDAAGRWCRDHAPLPTLFEPVAGGYRLAIRSSSAELLKAYQPVFERVHAVQEEYARRLAVAAAGVPTAGDAEALLAEAAGFAADLDFVRPFLPAASRHEVEVVELAPGFFGRFRYEPRFGQSLGGLYTAFDPAHLAPDSHPAADATWGVRRDGRLCAAWWPWITCPDDGRLGENRVPAAAVYRSALAAVHARVMGQFDRIDLGRLMRNGPPARAAEAVVLACARREAAEPVPQAAGRVGGHTLPVIRLSRLVDCLQALGCEVRRGKGSEVVVRHPATGRRWTLGQHTRDPQYHPVGVCRMLRRLGIDEGLWAAVFGR